MNGFNRLFSKALALLVVAMLCASAMTVCMAGSYNEYYNGYVTLMANGILDADITLDLEMDGKTSSYSGNMKIDFTRNLMIYEMNNNGHTMVSFTDGTTLYTSADGEKQKYSLDQSSSAGQSEPSKPDGQEAPTFTVQDFIDNFSSLLEPGQIAQLGLLSPVAEAVVTNVSQDGDVYTLDIAEGLAKIFLNSLTKSVTREGSETVSFTDLKNFGYKATVVNSCVTGSEYYGELTVHVPGSLSKSSDADYKLTFDMKIKFNNAGNEPTFELPSTDGYADGQPNTRR